MDESVRGIIRRPFVIIGAGNVGNAIARAVRQAGLKVEAVISRSHPDATDLAEAVGAPVAATHVTALPKVPVNVACTVPDNELDNLASTLSGVRHDWHGDVVFHTSGARPVRVLDSLRESGAFTASFHPLKSIPDGRVEGVLEDAVVGISGDAPALEVCSSLARLIGSRPVQVPDDAKAAYHLGASVASNFLVALFGMANEIVTAAGFSDLSAAELYAGLANNTIDNIASMGPADALTGPIARGDTSTIEIHMEFLRERVPHLMPVYSSLATETVRLAVRSGKLDAGKAREVLDAIHNALLPSIDQDRN